MPRLNGCSIIRPICILQAIGQYRQVEDRFSDAKLSIAHFLRKTISLPEVTTVKPETPVELELKFRNLADCDVKVYRVDLMKLGQLKGDLGHIAEVNLAGIRPLYETTEKLGDGNDYRNRVHKLSLPMAKEGAYLVVARGESLYTTGLVLVTSLAVEVETGSADRQVCVMVRDTVADRYLTGVEVRVIDPATNRSVVGKTDLRGVFLAQGFAGSPVARTGSDLHDPG